MSKTNQVVLVTDNVITILLYSSLVQNVIIINIPNKRCRPNGGETICLSPMAISVLSGD